jgi:hypothetical protein
VEKALVCFPSSPLAQRGITVSLTHTLEGIPKAYPPVVARQLTLTSFFDLPRVTLEQVFDAVRYWGSVELLNLVRAGRYWVCRIQFYFEDEASRFQLEFAQAGFYDWDV